MSDRIVPIHRDRQGEGKEPASRKRKSGGKLGHFLINKQSAVPLHMQLKEQIRYAIMSGVFEPGQPLPSIRELTAKLGVHRNTVHRVYLELQASGLLSSRPGKGVFVSESLSEAHSIKELNQVDDLIEQMFAQANELGINPITLHRLIGQRAPAFDSRHPNVAFVECTFHQTQEIARELTESFGVTVQRILLDDLRTGKIKLSVHLRHVVTSIFHYDEVRDLVGGQNIRVHPVTYELHPATRRLLRELPADTRLGFICHDANTEEVIGKEINDRVPEGVLVGCASLESVKPALELVTQVDTVIFSEPASAFCVKNCTPDHTLLELHFALNPSSVEKVTRILHFQP
ncbi:MAG: GntR family transcriptional regulator [Deltaproteobacteria bacterium]|nr:GntR family transcriptional regulator [Deltaproteobacteria bacterium]